MGFLFGKRSKKEKAQAEAERLQAKLQGNMIKGKTPPTSGGATSRGDARDAESAAVEEKAQQKPKSKLAIDLNLISKINDAPSKHSESDKQAVAENPEPSTDDTSARPDNKTRTASNVELVKTDDSKTGEKSETVLAENNSPRVRSDTKGSITPADKDTSSGKVLPLTFADIRRNVRKNASEPEGQASQSESIFRKRLGGDEESSVNASGNAESEPLDLVQTISPVDAKKSSKESQNNTESIVPLRTKKRPTPISTTDGNIAPTVRRGVTRLLFPEKWMGTWMAEDGRALYIEPGESGSCNVTAFIDPTDECVESRTFPGIRAYKMPAYFLREYVDDLLGERLVIQTVPGLGRGLSGPEVHLYFLTDTPGGEDGDVQFALPKNQLSSMRVVVGLSQGSAANPWGDEDEIDWLLPPSTFIKGPKKMDSYLAKKIAKYEA